MKGGLNSIPIALAATKFQFIWKNVLRIFENKNRTPERLAMDISRHFAFWHPGNLNTLKKLTNKKILLDIDWKLPVIETLKLNRDAS